MEKLSAKSDPIYLGEAIVKKALAVMIQHNLVKFQASERNNNVAEYSMMHHNVYCLIRYPKYLYMIKRIYGTSEEILLEILLNLGQASASNVIFHSANRLNEANDSEVLSPSALHQSFQRLAQDNFIIRCPKLAENATLLKVPTLEIEEKEKFAVPNVEIEPIARMLKEKATQLGGHCDSEIIWRVNHERFDIELRNVILVNAAARRVDTTAGELYHLILKLWRESSNPDSPATTPVSYNVIKDAVRKNDSSPILLEHFDHYLRVLHEDSAGLIDKPGDAGGGQFNLDYSKVFENLACASLDSIVLERFGSKALRLFRLTRIQKFMEQDQMQNVAMIPAKEAKMFTYKLLEHNFLQIKELKKGTSNFAPVKSFILYHVDLPQVVRTVLEASYKGLFNAMVRQMHDLTENKRLLEKHAMLESMLERLKGDDGVPEEEIAELSDTMHPAEKSLVEKIHLMSDNLTLGQTQADETILILESYLKFKSKEL
uniref:DNA-directed RNA polymerase III subunit RPC3 n=1 Tax=Daphnia pulex TaxID=6669 RepID=A0A4Y7MUS7_DAPPU|nr:EOG090X04YD [Daphnia pulex]